MAAVCARLAGLGVHSSELIDERYSSENYIACSTYDAVRVLSGSDKGASTGCHGWPSRLTWSTRELVAVTLNRRGRLLKETIRPRDAIRVIFKRFQKLLEWQTGYGVQL